MGKASLIPIRTQSEMPDRCTEGRLEKGIRPPPVEPKILGAQAVPKQQEIGLDPVLAVSPVHRKIQMAPLVAEIEIEAKPPIRRKQRKFPRNPGQG